ncbi:MAG: aldo/keto reductase [Turicibacter sp.]|nr:aldo/keto reductase [Turicibacter sp.]
MNYTTLNNGVKMPMLGYGVFQIPSAETKRLVKQAIEVGYRLIDTAQSYGNEEGVGAAIKESGIDREEFFITTKIWSSNFGYEKAKKSIEDSLAKLQMDYIDLMLLHQPFGDTYGAYRALEEAYKAGKIRAIGVSNFYPDRLVDLIMFNEVTPAVNQIETHVFQQQAHALPVHEKYGVQLEGWAPFAEGQNDFFTNQTLQGIGANYGKSIGQVALRFYLQKGIVSIPKTVNISRMEENFNIFDFALNASDMHAIESLDLGKNLFVKHDTVADVERFAGFSGVEVSSKLA